MTSDAAVSKERHSYPALLLAGGMAGVASWLVTFPFDVIKTRVQSTLAPAPDSPYRNVMSTIVNSYRMEGPGVFFKGLKPTLIRCAPIDYMSRSFCAHLRPQCYPRQHGHLCDIRDCCAGAELGNTTYSD